MNDDEAADGAHAKPKRKRGRGTRKPRKEPRSRALGGRPPATPIEVKEAAKVYTMEALGTLVKIMRKSREDRERRQAAIAILDRGWGKPAMPISGPDGESPVVPQIPEMLEQLRRFAGGSE